MIPEMLYWKYGPVADCEFREGKWSIVRWRHKTIEQPSEEQLARDMVEYEAYLQATSYSKKRAAEYPSMQDQLDAIWKILDGFGIRSQVEDAAKTDPDIKSAVDVWGAVDSVKEKYPKPEAK